MLSFDVELFLDIMMDFVTKQLDKKYINISYIFCVTL